MAVDVRKLTTDVRRYIEAALGNLSPSGARDLARSMVERAQSLTAQGPGQAAGGVAGQVREVAQQLMDWSQQSRDQITKLVQREVRRQLSAVGVATRDDVDTLRKRVRELEKGGGSSPPAKRSRAKSSSSAKSSPTKAKRTTESTAKRTSSAKRSGGSSSSSRSGSRSGGGGS
jgi:hypothetical protein